MGVGGPDTAEAPESAHRSSVRRDRSASISSKKKNKLIITQCVLRYLVDWEPELDQDGNVTQTWDPTWERPEDISDDLIDDFEAERTSAL